MKDFLIKKVIPGLGIAVYAFGLIGGMICLFKDGHWPVALSLIPTFIFGAPVVYGCVMELFKKDSE